MLSQNDTPIHFSRRVLFYFLSKMSVLVHFSATLRALYLGDNDFEYLPADIENLSSLQILVLRENDLLALPKEVGKLYRLKELHVQVAVAGFSHFYKYLQILATVIDRVVVIHVVRVSEDSPSSADDVEK